MIEGSLIVKALTSLRPCNVCPLSNVTASLKKSEFPTELQLTGYILNGITYEEQKNLNLKQTFVSPLMLLNLKPTPTNLMTKFSFIIFLLVCLD